MTRAFQNLAFSEYLLSMLIPNNLVDFTGFIVMSSTFNTKSLVYRVSFKNIITLVLLTFSDNVCALNQLIRLLNSSSTSLWRIFMS